MEFKMQKEKEYIHPLIVNVITGNLDYILALFCLYVTLAKRFNLILCC